MRDESAIYFNDDSLFIKCERPLISTLLTFERDYAAALKKTYSDEGFFGSSKMRDSEIIDLKNNFLGLFKAIEGEIKSGTFILEPGDLDKYRKIVFESKLYPPQLFGKSPIESIFAMIEEASKKSNNTLKQ